jgi:hypothetical protein
MEVRTQIILPSELAGREWSGYFSALEKNSSAHWIEGLRGLSSGLGGMEN